VHSELNAILNFAGASLLGCRLYVTLFPCNECAKAIIQSGIKEIIFEEDRYSDTNEVIASKKLLKASNVKVRQYKKSGKEIKIIV
jgi:dCMP deaminase